ncbi:MAG: hypothetical protein AAF761_03755 [Pseudomonadota bacterium]
MMMFLVRAFRLSLSIFWRALPQWVLLSALLYTGFAMLSETPVVFFFIMLLIFGPTMFFMFFAHIRSGLSARGEVTPLDFGKLFKRSYKFYFFFGFMNILIGAFVIMGFFGFASAGFFDMTRAAELLMAGDDASMAQLEAMFAGPALSLFSLGSQVLSQLCYCACAVPMAANAAASSPKARDYEFFWGFGAFTGRMFLLNLIAGFLMILLAVAYAILLTTAPIFDGQALFAAASNPAAGFGLPTDWTAWAVIAALVLAPLAGVVWLISLWAAGATLCFVDHRARQQVKFDAEIARVYEAPADINDLRALRKSRMSGMTPAE